MTEPCYLIILYDCSTGEIQIANRNALTFYEKCIILATYTGDVNFHCFAAEIEYHAEKTKRPLIDAVYKKAFRADLTTIEEYDILGIEVSDFYDIYHDLESDIVVSQAEAHGEY